MLKSIFLIFGILLTISSSYLAAEEAQVENLVTLIINMENQKIFPRNFRITQEPYVFENSELSFQSLSLEGLHRLHSSASAQFSENSLTKMLEVIPAKNILILDLREESHGFLNGMAVSWQGERNWGNKDKSVEEILQDEKIRLQSSLDEKNVNIYKKTDLITPQVVHVEEAYSENQLAHKMGVHYLRIPSADHIKPYDKEIDHFVSLVKTNILNKETPDLWIHFHCSAGRGRSTTFMSIYDMMLNAQKVSFDDIISRQAMIGGKDLTEPFDVTDWRYYHQLERLMLLDEFYSYCLENPNFEQSWSSWKEKQIN